MKGWQLDFQSHPGLNGEAALELRCLGPAGKPYPITPRTAQPGEGPAGPPAAPPP